MYSAQETQSEGPLLPDISIYVVLLWHQSIPRGMLAWRTFARQFSTLDHVRNTTRLLRKSFSLRSSNGVGSNINNFKILCKYDAARVKNQMPQATMTRDCR